MNSKKLVAKVAATAIVVLAPIATLGASVSAEPKDAARTQVATGTGLNRVAANASLSRLSGLPFGGAALYDGTALYDGSALYNLGPAPATVRQSVANAWSSRFSGLPFGGAALDL